MTQTQDVEKGLYPRNYCLSMRGLITKAKGQLISKGLFVFFNSSKKRTKKLCPSRLWQKFKFSSSCFGRNEDNKISFRD